MSRFSAGAGRTASITILGLVLATGAAAGSDLWSEISGPAEARIVQPAPSVLDGLADGRLDRVTVSAGGRSYDVSVTKKFDNGRGVRSVEGVVPGAAGSFLLLTAGRDGSAAALFDPGHGELWRMSGREGRLVLEPADSSGRPSCGGAVAPTGTLTAGYGGIRGPADPPAGKAFGDAADDGSRHDVIVVWTPKAESYAGGAAQMEAEIQLAVDAANLTYVNSGVDARLRLVYSARTEYDEDTAWDYEDHVYALADPSDGDMDEVPTLRSITGADFMVLIVESVDALGNPIGACGIGFVMGPDSFVPEFEVAAASVVTRSCASSVWTLAHEIGHNKGCAHNREDAGIDGLTSYAHGHRYTGDDGEGYRTVMSYDTDPESFIRIPYFANPAVSHAGEPTGVAVGAPGEAHNVLVHDTTDNLCATFRPERTFVTFWWTGVSTGLVDAPFADLADGLTHARDGGQVVLSGDAPGYAATLTDPSVLICLDDGSSVLGAPARR